MDWPSLLPFFLLIWALAALLQLIRVVRAREGVPLGVVARDFVVSATAVSLVLIADEARRTGLVPAWAFAVVLLAVAAGLFVLLRPHS